MDDLKGVGRLMRGLATGRIRLDGITSTAQQAAVPVGLVRKVVSFALIGVVSTLAYMGLYVLFRGPLPALAANAMALLVTAFANTAANRWFTFGVRGPQGRARHQAQGLLVLVLALGLTSGSLALLHALAPGASHAVELVVLTLANLAATVMRFVLLNTWVFGRRQQEVAS
jgi:putative flippase GtrA